MKKSIIALISVSFAAILAIALYHFWPRNHLDVQLLQSEKSPDGRWTAVVQLEVFNTAWVVNEPIYAVRLKGRGQRDTAGDMVTYVEVDYPTPAPSVTWNNNELIVALPKNQSFYPIKQPIDGVPVVASKWVETGAGQASNHDDPPDDTKARTGSANK